VYTDYSAYLGLNPGLAENHGGLTQAIAILPLIHKDRLSFGNFGTTFDYSVVS